MEQWKVKNLYSLSETIAADIFEGVEYPWEALGKIKDFIMELGAKLPEEKYEKRGEDVWVAKSAKVFPSAYINGPAIIDEDAEIRHCAFIRGSAIFLTKSRCLITTMWVTASLDIRRIWEPVPLLLM